MANILSDAKKQQVIALGQLGWTLRRIEAATGVRRETAGAYLKAAGLAVRPPGRWGHPPANPAKAVSTDPRADHAGPGRPAAVAAAAEPGPHRQRLRAVPRTDRAGPRPGSQRDGDLAGSRRRSRLSRPVRQRAPLRRDAARAADARGAPRDRHRARRGSPGRLRRRPNGGPPE